RTRAARPVLAHRPRRERQEIRHLVLGKQPVALGELREIPERRWLRRLPGSRVQVGEVAVVHGSYLKFHAMISTAGGSSCAPIIVWTLRLATWQSSCQSTPLPASRTAFAMLSASPPRFVCQRRGRGSPLR